eukprot:8808498-Pyramimonas_sp.AAC.1
MGMVPMGPPVELAPKLAPRQARLVRVDSFREYAASDAWSRLPRQEGAPWAAWPTRQRARPRGRLR